MSSVLSVLRTQPTRVFGVVVAVIALVAAFGVAVPTTEVEGVVLAFLALVSGHSIQKSQDATVNAALYSYPPEIADGSLDTLVTDTPPSDPAVDPTSTVPDTTSAAPAVPPAG